MFTKLFGFYSLEACVAAAVSQSKKAVSSAAAAVVGIGLFTAPIDSAHGQVLSYSGVSGITLDMVDLGGDDVIAGISVDLHVFDTSADYDVTVHWPLGGYETIRDFGSSAYQSVFRRFEWLPLVGGLDWRVRFEVLTLGTATDWIEVYIFSDPFGYPVSAASISSDGNWRDVPLTLNRIP